MTNLIQFSKSQFSLAHEVSVQFDHLDSGRDAGVVGNGGGVHGALQEVGRCRHERLPHGRIQLQGKESIHSEDSPKFILGRHLAGATADVTETKLTGTYLH